MTDGRKTITPVRLWLSLGRSLKSRTCKSLSIFALCLSLAAVPAIILWSGLSVEVLVESAVSRLRPAVVARIASGDAKLDVVDEHQEFFRHLDLTAVDEARGVTEAYLLKESALMTIDPLHLHGRVGLDESGSPAWTPEPLRFRMSQSELESSYRGYAFNSRRSRALALDRPVPDFNSRECRSVKYDTSRMPRATVIFVFHNEDLSALLRSVHSVLNRTPAELLAEIILVDDNSNPTSHPWLFSELDRNLKFLPKTRVRRLKERNGLMMARIRGAEWARGDTLVFLDSHIECGPRWLEPLVQRTFESPKTIVVPMIHTIDHEYMDFQSGHLTVLSFSWSLGQTHPYRIEPAAEPMPSPVMAGGLFAANYHWFIDVLDGYDREMRLYGGEEMEIGFKTWMCGGALEALPCSRVGHIFRSPKYWKGQVYKVPGDEIHRNKLRTALVWMDDHARLAELCISKLPQRNPLGDLTHAKQVRQQCGSKNFQWYLDNVVPDMFVPKISNWSNTGALKNAAFNICIDSFNGNLTSESHCGAYSCHHSNGTQAWALDDRGNLLEAATLNMCIQLTADGLRRTNKCTGITPTVYPGWTREKARTKTLMRHDNLETVEVTESLFVFDGKCLEVERKPDGNLSAHSVKAGLCDEANPAQWWYFYS
ncbi:MAG: uncharacterized protein KVP18_002809 [Porospora cf. gigantea A]|uniref:uncharacterized protein n=1 Tax=Porospora cf. gigantea A TaxID=2853593 RepID=UPI0035594771|nr:MAG: hypothetical protein KVP18_002809 [Porospora cf. gigantea A]